MQKYGAGCLNDLSTLEMVSKILVCSLSAIRDRSFFMREGGPLEKNWLERGGQLKKIKERGGDRTKKLD